MSDEEFIQRTRLHTSARRLFAWHTRPGALQRLTPPWAPIEIVTPAPVREGAQVTVRVPIGPVRTTWVAEHRDIEPGRRFRDVMIRGPFAKWEHTHRFEPVDDEVCYLEDRVRYALPGGVLGRVAASAVRRELRRQFTYRHAVTAADIAAHDRFAGAKPMKVLISGSTGLIGSELVSMLKTGGHEVVRLSRSASPDKSEEPVVQWAPGEGRLDSDSLQGIDAVVHLAGENLATRWSEEQKRKIRDSRVQGTRLLSEAIAALTPPPRVMISASAVGYYGNRGATALTEDAGPGAGFLAEVCQAWEDAAEPARQAGIRVVHPRLGVVLSPKGGALGLMLKPFKMGAGGKIGSGDQYMSWVAIDDAIGILHFLLMTESLAGPVNATAPGPVTNRQFTKTLGHVLGRPTLAPMPAFAAKLAFGEMADEMLLVSQRVLPRRLEDAGYAFRFPELEGALRHLLGR